MRYYRLEITRPDGSLPTDEHNNPLIHPLDTSVAPGSGLHIEFDALVTGQDTANGGTVLTIYGLPISTISQAVNLRGCIVRLRAGFTSGLPLANPNQAGWIIHGEVLNAYGNWIGTHQTLNLVINPSQLRNVDESKFSIQLGGKSGENLADVLTRNLKQAYPDEYVISVNISERLVLPEDCLGAYPRIGPYASMIRSLSRGIISDSEYSGVQISVQAGRVIVFDNYAPKTKITNILQQELLGQPTWIANNAVSFKCPMRADLISGDFITLPENIISGAASILSVNSADTWAVGRSGKNKVNFSGNFLIQTTRHVGQYLNPNGNDAWVTIYEAVAEGSGES